jgi:hypothetical protein
MKNIVNPSKLAQAASALGAGILGFGIGAMWGYIIGSAILIIITVIGGFLHLFGMYIIQLKNAGKNTEGIAKALWITAWLCLLTIVVLFIYLLIS